MGKIIIRNGLVVNEGVARHLDILINGQRIEKIDHSINEQGLIKELVAEERLVLPGIIDDQVHFREPGLTHKATIASESRAALAGGTTSFMEMPNTQPPALTQKLLSDKYDIAANTSYANYSFYMGASNENLEEVLRTDGQQVCGVKIFMGSSTGKMLVDDRQVLEKLFANVPILIATHCEDEQTIKRNTEKYRSRFGERLTAAHHPLIRSREGCLLSSSLAVELAHRYGTRLHVLHISTEDELYLFDSDEELANKRITAEVCVHHLYFSAADYGLLGNKIKCNPAIKNVEDQNALLQALRKNRLDVIATDHAPHTLAEKERPYLEAPSGLPLVQHSLNIMSEFCQKGLINWQEVVQKMCHAPATAFQVKDRGYLREGYCADVVVFDPRPEWKVDRSNILYKAGWSPLEGKEWKGKVEHVILNGHHVVVNGKVSEVRMGERLIFMRH